MDNRNGASPSNSRGEQSNRHYRHNRPDTLSPRQRVMVVTALMEAVYACPIGMPESDAYNLVSPMGVSLPMWAQIRCSLLDNGTLLLLGRRLLISYLGMEVLHDIRVARARIN